MCAQFLIKTNLEEIRRRFGIIGPIDDEIEKYLDLRFLPHSKAPVIVSDGNKNVVKLMNFSLIPSWSKERRVKFATHNARLETVSDKPTWKKPFLEKRALIPISKFVEPIYVDKLAGNMVQFFQKPSTSSQNELLVAAGIYDEWVDRNTGEVIESFSILTNDPPKYVALIGHDRCPIFLRDSAFQAWLDPKPKTAAELRQLLLENVLDVDFDVQVDRPLKPGWEKRVPN